MRTNLLILRSLVFVLSGIIYAQTMGSAAMNLSDSQNRVKLKASEALKLEKNVFQGSFAPDFNLETTSVDETVCFLDDFSDIVNGHSNDHNGSNSQWNGNDDFPTVQRAFQAGGAVKLGTGSKIGFIESRDLTEVEGDITVNLMVKGWTNVEGDLIVSIDGQSETLSYTAVMADDFEMITASFEGVTAGSNLKIETSAKRAFIDNVEIICEEEAVVEGCLDAPYEQYPGAVYQPVCVGVDEMIVLDGWSGEYSLVALTSGVDYTFKSSITTDYITISNAEGTEVLAVGEGVVEFTASADMEVRFYTHVNDQCETDLENRARIVFCGEVVVVEEPDFECLKGNGLADTEIEDGYNITEESEFGVASKFVVDEGMEMEVHQITLDVLTLSNISNSTINLREDLSGTPGEIIETITIQPTEAIVHSVLFGYSIYHLVYDLDGPIVLGEGTYWIEPSLTSEANNEVYWALIPSSSTEANLFLSDDFGETWVEDDENFSTMFFVAGVCAEATEEPEDCEAVDVPYVMDFETAIVPNMPDCTSVENAGSGNNWVTTDEAIGDFTGIYLSYEYNSSNQANSWFYTQGINLEAGESYKVTYDYGSRAAAAFPENLRVAYGTNAEHTSMTTVLAEHVGILTGGDAITHEVVFTADASGVYYFGFNAFSDANKWFLYLDNILIDQTDEEPEPEPEPQDPCDEKVIMECGVEYTADLVPNAGVWTNYTDVTWDYNGSEQVFEFTAEMTGDYEFILDEGAADVDFFVMDACSNTANNLIGGYWTGEVNQTLFLTEGQTIYIIADLFSSSTPSTVSIQVNCPTEPFELTCEDNFVASNNLENGLFFGGDSNQRLAIDVIVGDEGFTVYGMDLNIFTDGNTDLDFYFTIYEDESNLPGAVYNDNGFGNVYSTEYVGDAFGFDVYNYVVAFDTPVTFEANTKYWIEVETNGIAWEATEVNSFGSGLAFANDGVFGEWTSGGIDELVYSLVCEELGVSDLSSFDFAYYPNPVRDVLNITSQKAVESVEVYNLTGQKVINESKVNQGQIDVSKLSAGTYVFRVTLEEGQVETFKIIKR